MFSILCFEEDVFRRTLQYLSLRDLLRLRATCSFVKALIDSQDRLFVPFPFIVRVTVSNLGIVSLIPKAAAKCRKIVIEVVQHCTTVGNPPPVEPVCKYVRYLYWNPPVHRALIQGNEDEFCERLRAFAGKKFRHLVVDKIVCRGFAKDYPKTLVSLLDGLSEAACARCCEFSIGGVKVDEVRLSAALRRLQVTNLDLSESRT